MGFYRLPKIIGKGNKPSFGARINWNHPLSQGLFGAWLFNEGGGNTIYDISKTCRRGNFVNGPVWSGDYLEVPLGSARYVTLDTNTPATQSGFTYFIYYMPYGTTRYYTTLIGLDGNNLLYWNGSYFKLGMYLGADYIMSATNSLLANLWYKIVVTAAYSGGDTVANTYINGIHDAATPVTMIGKHWDGSFKYFWWDTAGAEYGAGRLASFLYWDRVLSEVEIASLHANPYQMFEWPVWDYYFVPAAAPPPTGGKSIFGYDSIFHAGGIIQT